MRNIVAISMVIAGLSTTAWAETVSTPSNLQVLGTITSSGADAPTIVSGNSVYAINKSSGATEGSGSVLDVTGTYLIDMSKESSFNGTTLTLRLSNGGKTYKLMEGTTETEFVFSGGFPFPAKVMKSVTVGDVVSGGSGGGGTGGGSTPVSGDGDCGGTDSSFDANGDGISNQADIDFIKSQLGAQNPTTAADINKDGRVTTADVIAAMRTTAGSMRGRTACPPKATTTSTTDSSASSSSTAQ